MVVGVVDGLAGDAAQGEAAGDMQAGVEMRCTAGSSKDLVEADTVMEIAETIA